MTVVLRSINVGLPRTIDTAAEDRWTTGMFKTPVTGSVQLGPANLAGDGQADLENHGGPDKAVNVYCAEHYPFWEAELGIGPLLPGAFGENFTLTGLLEPGACIGDIWQVGTARLQVSQPRQPCWKLARRWQREDLAFRVQQSGRTGWYLRVLVPGAVQAGDHVELVERPHPQWTIATANEVMHQRRDDRAAAAALAACPALATGWRRKLACRAGGAGPEDTARRLTGPNG